jgi:hypothetical protein
VSAQPRPELKALRIADPSERWSALGFEVAGGSLVLEGVTLHLDARGRGIVSWGLSGIDRAPVDIDGLATEATEATEAAEAAYAIDVADSPAREHPNGATGIDHVVVVTPEFDRTAIALERVGLPLRRIRDVPSTGGRAAFRQGFRRLGPAILELVESLEMGPGPARFYGLVVIVSDLDALAVRLGDRLGSIHDAVQPGRRIGTLAAGAGLSPRLAFMDPDPGPRDH